MPANSLVSSHERIAFDQLAPFSRLFTEYTRYTDGISPFFNGDYRSPENFETQARRTLTVERDRNLVADVLLDQNTRWGLDDRVAKNIELLRQDDAVVVVTGQQLGLFLSPLYIPYKTLTTICLARKLSDQLGLPVVPVFWLHGEDHDFEETTPVHLIDQNHELVSLKYDPQPTPPHGPVGRMTFTQEIDRVVHEVEQHLPPSPNKEEVVGFLRQHFAPGNSVLDAFAFFLKRMFKESGLVLFSVDDERIKRTCAPLFQREILHPMDATAAVDRTSMALSRDYHIQVKSAPINLFMMDDASRLSITARSQDFVIKGQPAPMSEQQLLDILEQTPERFSPNVILRPIVQDFIFPSIAYIAGPGEIAYFAQMKGAYEVAGIPMPLIYPRASLTLIEPTVTRVLNRYSYALPEYNEDPNKLFRRHAIDHLPIDVDALAADALTHIDHAINTLRDSASAIHPTLHTSAESTRARFHKQIEKYKEQIIKGQKRNQHEDRIHLLKASNHLFPHQKLQERVLSPLHYLNLYGLDFFNSLIDDISLDTTEHQIIRL